MRTIDNELAAVLEAPHTSPWLRQVLQSALQRDPVEAANDAAELARLLAGRVEAMFFLDTWRTRVGLRTTMNASPG